jgi:hypothetical protein
MPEGQVLKTIAVHLPKLTMKDDLESNTNVKVAQKTRTTTFLSCHNCMPSYIQEVKANKSS